MKNQKLSNEEIIGICDKVIIYLQSEDFCNYLCFLFASCIKEEINIPIGCTSDQVGRFIPEFTRENAIKFGACSDLNYSTWWPCMDTKDRIAFVKWIKEQYKK